MRSIYYAIYAILLICIFFLCGEGSTDSVNRQLLSRQNAKRDSTKKSSEPPAVSRAGWSYPLSKEPFPLSITKIIHPSANKCFVMKVQWSATVEVCFPAIIVSGLPHSGSSFVHQLMSSLPGSVLHDGCPTWDDSKNLWRYIQTLPNPKSLSASSLVIGKCQDFSAMWLLRQVLRDESAAYIVVLRDYADLLWANFNSYCKKDFDRNGCENSRLVDAKRHSRSPEQFQTIIESDINGQTAISPFYKPLDQPCQHVDAVFDPILRARASTNQTVLVVAIEQAVRYPIQIVHRIGSFIRRDVQQLDLKKMFQIGEMFVERSIPAADDLNAWQNLDYFDQNTFKISQYKPMLNSTRRQIDKCWQSQCVKLSHLSKYPYPACSGSGSGDAVGARSGKHKDTGSKKKSGLGKEKEKDKTKGKEVTSIIDNSGGGGGGSSSSSSSSSSSIDIDKDKRLGKPSKEKPPVATSGTTATTAATTPAVAAAAVSSVSQSNMTWQLANERGVMKNQVLTISKIAHPLNSMHSCYTITCTGNQCPSDKPCRGGTRKCGIGTSPVINVCYPGIMVTGMTYAGTDLTHSVLSQIPGAITSGEKDNCPFNKRRPHWVYFNSLPRMETLGATSIVVDSCMDMGALVEMRKKLKDPITVFVVPVRNYADMLWSMFNTQCKSGFDKAPCGPNRELVASQHARSPELFHSLIMNDRNKSNEREEQPFDPPYHEPCSHADAVFKEYLKFSFEVHGLLSMTTVISIESLIADPIAMIKRVLKRIHYPDSSFDMGKLAITDKGILLEHTYNATQHRPMLTETRTILDQCWQNDCKVVALLSGHSYSACLDALITLRNTGGSSVEETPLASLSVLKSFEMQIDITNKTYDVDYWDLNTQKGIIRGQSLRLMKTTYPGNKFHTCYTVKCTGKHCPTDEPCKGNVNVCGRGQSSMINVCYPAVIITGLPKCGTSAMYDLLSRFPGAVLMPEKENCPSIRRRPHWVYFNSLPRMESLSPNSIIIDGCIDVTVNMKMRSLLHNPQVLYIIMIRNYAEMLWSSYNFWCKREYDKANCDYSKWANPEVHVRSPELFHELIDADRNGTYMVQPFYKPMDRPCVYAGGYYTEYLEENFMRSRLMNQTLVIASEELDSNPYIVAKRVAKVMAHDLGQLNLKNFTKIRVNSQENKGGSNSIPIELYKPGLYNISKYRPMLAETRTMLDKCWYADCKKLLKLTNYSYPACSS